MLADLLSECIGWVEKNRERLKIHPGEEVLHERFSDPAEAVAPDAGRMGRRSRPIGRR